MHFGHSVLIDVIAERPRLDMILARLRAAGLEPSRYRSRDADNNRPLLIDLSSAGHTAIFDAIAVLSSGASAVFVLGDRLPDGLDQAIHIERDADLMDVYDKVRAHTRASIEAHESSLFLETLAEFGVTRPDINERPRILLVGKYSPKFLALQTALSQHGFDVVASLTPLTATTYLATSNFAAVVAIDLDAYWRSALDGHDVAKRTLLAVCQSRDAAKFDGAAIHFDYGSSDQPTLGSDLGKLRTLEPVRWHAPSAQDPITGLLNQTAFLRHLDKQMPAARAQGEPLSVAAIRVRRLDALEEARRACERLADRAVRHVRRTDRLARLDWTTIAISARASGHAEAARLAERIVTSTNSDVFSFEVCEMRAVHRCASDMVEAVTERQYRPAAHHRLARS